MGAVFGYGRVSTREQTAENQRMEIESAGFRVDYWFADEGVSGAVMAKDRPQFAAMLSKIRKGETLVVTKIDRLGRDAIDIQSTVKALESQGVKVHVTQLGGVDLTASAGKMLLAMLSAFAEMERDLIIERTQAGLARARAEGRKLGRPTKTTGTAKAAILKALSEGETVSSVAREHSISRASVIEIRKAARVAEGA